MTDKSKPGSNKQAWVAAGFQLLSVGGIDSVRIDRISKKIGLTRGSFYWHFKNRAELLDEMLKVWHQLGTLQVIRLVEAEKTNPHKKLSTLLELTTRRPGEKYGGKFTELSIRVWGGQSEQAAKIIKQIDNERVAYVHKLLIDMQLEPALASLLAEVIYNAFIGMMSRDLTEKQVSVIANLATNFLEDQISQVKS